MKYVAGENGRNLEKTYPDSVSSNTKHIWSDRDANSVSHRWEASVYLFAPRSRLRLIIIIIIIITITIINYLLSLRVSCISFSVMIIKSTV